MYSNKLPSESPSLKRIPKGYFIFPALLTGIGIALLVPLPADWSVGWRAEWLNRMHVPLMAVYCVAIEGLFRNSSLINSHRAFWAALSAVFFAAMVELVQPWFHRTADMGDFMWGMAGIAAGSLWNTAILAQSHRMRVIISALALACTLLPPLGWGSQVMRAKLAAERLFPVIVDTSGNLGNFFWTMEPEELSVSQQLKERGEIILTKSGEHPSSARLDAQNRDWSQFDGLAIDGTLEAPTAIELGLRLDLNDVAGPRLRAGSLVQPGRHQIQIWWPGSPPPRNVHQLVVFLASGEPAARLRIHHMQLVRRVDAARQESND